jgi:hypothetical protein
MVRVSQYTEKRKRRQNEWTRNEYEDIGKRFNFKFAVEKGKKCTWS